MTHQARWYGVSCVGGPTGGGSVKGANRFVRLARVSGRTLLHRVRREQLVIGGVPIKLAAGPCASGHPVDLRDNAVLLCESADAHGIQPVKHAGLRALEQHPLSLGHGPQRSLRLCCRARVLTLLCNSNMRLRTMQSALLQAHAQYTGTLAHPCTGWAPASSAAAAHTQDSCRGMLMWHQMAA